MSGEGVGAGGCMVVAGVCSERVGAAAVVARVEAAEDGGAAAW